MVALKTLFILLQTCAVSVMGMAVARDASSSTVASGHLFADPLANPAHVNPLANATLVSSNTLANGVKSSTWRLSKATGGSLKNTEVESNDDLVKRGTVNVEGNRCLTSCGFNGQRPNPSDCEVVFGTLYNKATQFSVAPRTVVYWTYNSCASYFVNTSGDNVVYDNWDFGGTSQWLNGFCINKNGAPFGGCLFDRYSTFGNGAYVSVNHVNYYG